MGRITTKQELPAPWNAPHVQEDGIAMGLTQAHLLQNAVLATTVYLDLGLL